MIDSIQQFGNIGVLMGGCSSERDVSLKSGQAVCQALKKGGANVFPVEINSRDEQVMLSLLKDKSIDIVFIALHGEFGEDGAVQKIFERENICYTGSNVASSQLAMNKAATQDVLKKNGIRVPSFQVLKKKQSETLQEVCLSLLDFPYVVKPSQGGSSIGISLVGKASEWAGALESAFKQDDMVLIEKYIAGREMTCGVLEDKALPIVEICSHNEFFDYQSKYEKGMTDYIVPARISDVQKRIMQEAALKSFHLIGCRDFSRIDFILDEFDNAFLLEVNTIPGFTETSLLPKAAREAGYDFCQLCFKICELAACRLIDNRR